MAMKNIISQAKITKSKSGTLQIILAFLASAIGYLVGKYLGIAVLLASFIFIFAIVMGIKFPAWYMKKAKINHKLISFIIWSNLLSWFFPVLGLFTGLCAIHFGHHIPEKNTRYILLGSLGIVFALTNAAIGVMMRLQA